MIFLKTSYNQYEVENQYPFPDEDHVGQEIPKECHHTCQAK
jgi:hypothetical protein